MNKSELENLKVAAEQRCQQLFQQVNDTQVELERARGDFRTYESLLANWDDNETPAPLFQSPQPEGYSVYNTDEENEVELKNKVKREKVKEK